MVVDAGIVIAGKQRVALPAGNDFGNPPQAVPLIFMTFDLQQRIFSGQGVPQAGN
jgi:hypothetical protein